MRHAQPHQLDRSENVCVLYINGLYVTFKAGKSHFGHLTLKNRSKVKFKVTYVKAIPYFLYVFYSKFIHTCNIKATKLHFVHLTLKSRSKVKFKVAYVKIIYGFLYVPYGTQHAICNILEDIYKKHY
jgi:hypothetical protein